jgi:hypothetical protein
MSKPLPDADLDRMLAAQVPPSAPRPPDAFWADFRARATDLAEPRRPPAPARRPFLLPLGIAAALALAAILALRLRHDPAALPKDTPTGPLAAFQEYEVLTPHQGVLIIDGPDTPGAILWILDEKRAKARKGASS